MKKLIILFSLCFLLSGCGSNNLSLSKFDINQIISEGDYIIVDVRTKEEYDEYHLKEAINISYDLLNEDIKLDKSKTILVYCRSGNRSKIAFNNLKRLGYQVYDLGAIDDIDLPKE